MLKQLENYLFGGIKFSNKDCNIVTVYRFSLSEDSSQKGKAVDKIFLLLPTFYKSVGNFKKAAV